jgi:uracil phosphoribosyltransferase
VLHVSSHPLVQHKVALLRHVESDPPLFRRLVADLATLVAYEATQDLRLAPAEVPTPMGTAHGQQLAAGLVLVPILRAGLGMLEPLLDLIPQARVWHVGLFRDERTLEPVEYYRHVSPEPEIELALVLDPMLATGGSASATVDMLKTAGCPRVTFVGLIAAPEGVERLARQHPDVDVHVAALDERLNEVGYIVPGLGDAGDRQFGTR